MKSLKLNKFQANQLSEREMKTISGACKFSDNCGCACAYANSGGSSTNSNFGANDAGGHYSPQCIDYD